MEVEIVNNAKFRIKNGLKATLRLPNHPEMMQLLKNCRNMDPLLLHPYKLYAIEVEVFEEKVYFIYFITYKSPKHIIARLQHNLLEALSQNSYIIYNDISYTVSNKTNHALINAVIKKVKPGIAALIT